MVKGEGITCSASLFFRLRYGACCDSAVDVTGDKVVFVVVTRNFSVTTQGISISSGVSSTSRVLEESSLCHARYGCRRLPLHRRAEHNIRLGHIIVAQTQVSVHSKLTFPIKILVASNHALLNPCRLQSCPAQELCPTQTLKQPFRHPTACSIVDRPMDPEVLTANRNRTAAARRRHDQICREHSGSHAQFSVDSQLQSQAASKTHIALFCISEWFIKGRF